MIDFGPPVHYFGEPWGRAATPAAIRVDTPVGKPCLYCTVAIAEGDNGIMQAVVSPHPHGVTIKVSPIHSECDLRSVAGSIFDLKGECEYRGHCNELREAAGMTLRDDALAVWEWYQSPANRLAHWADDIDDHRSCR